MTVAQVAEPRAVSIARDLLGAAPVATLRALAAALAVAALGQLPPSLFNVAGGGLELATQLRVGWLYTMAGHAVAVEASGSAAPFPNMGDGVHVRLGLLTIAAVAAAMLAVGARAAARRVDDIGMRRAMAGALVAVPYAAVIGGVNAAVALELAVGPDATTTVVAPVWEGFVLPGALAAAAGIVGGWSGSRSWHHEWGRAVSAGMRVFAWGAALAFIGLLSFASLRPEGLERYSVEVWSGGGQRASVYLGHQALVLPDQAMWILATSMGSCVSLRVDAAAHDLLCLDRLPRGPDPASWLIGELGRVDGAPDTAPMPAVAWLFLVVPAAALVLGFKGSGRTAASLPRAAAFGASGGLVYAVLVTVTSLAGSLWVVTGDAGQGRFVAIGPDPARTAVLSLAWGVIGGALVCSSNLAWRRFSRRARPR